MIDFHELGYWVVAIGLLIAVPLLTRHRADTEHAAGERLRQLGVWTLDRLRPAPDFDELTADLSHVVRTQQLRANLQRVQRIMATDEWMSATRQIGNRLAYARLVRDLEDALALEPAIATYSAIDRWNVAAPPVRAESASSLYPQRGPTVEVLDIGWKGR